MKGVEGNQLAPHAGEQAWELGQPGFWTPVLNHCTNSPLCFTSRG